MAKQNLEGAPKMLAGGVTQAQLDAWKAKHGEVHIISVEVSKDDKAVGYYRKPDRDVLANVVNKATDGLMFEAREFLAQNTWLGGDKRHQTNDDVAIPAQTRLYASLNFLKAEAAKY
ncbi:MAG: hypothetical protein IE931_05530 [Sphingobacteriales bacterium]|nr:hypothetical protein [Sphingobacteriales bacterium]